MLKKIILIAFLLVPFAAPFAIAGGADWSFVADEIETALHSAGEAYGEGNVIEAQDTVSRAYLELFEGGGLEAAISLHISERRKLDIEEMFGTVRDAMDPGGPVSGVMEKVDLLVSTLKEVARSLPVNGGPKESALSLFFKSFIIILREGFEAILVISALSAWLVKSGHTDKVRTIYKGAGAALVASVITAILLQTLIKISGAGREALEGVTMLLATAVLFYVSYWLISKIEIGRWQNYIRSKVEGSLTRANLFALGFAAFLAVYREGAETILFYGALYSSSGGESSIIASGFIIGVLALVGVFIIIQYTSVRIPIGPFFAVTSTLLYYLAFSFAGKGTHELQEAGWISSTVAEGLPTIRFLGIYPTWEGVWVQSLLFLALLFAVLYCLVIRPYRERGTLSNGLTHMELDIRSLHNMLNSVSEHAMKAHGLSSGRADREADEIRRHLVRIDSKVHLVMEHLMKLKEGIFTDTERDIKKAP